jgi:hypothetical protein
MVELESMVLNNLRVGDMLVEYDVCVKERGFGYPPGFSGTVNAAGMWTDEVPYTIERIRLEEVESKRTAFIFPTLGTLVRCDNKIDPVSTEDIGKEVMIVKRATQARSALCGAFPRTKYYGMKD